jgi:hypothetical protein
MHVPGVGERGAGNVLNGRFMLKSGLLSMANINNHLTTASDPNRKFRILE